MSIDLNWETLTTGPDGIELAHKIRDFIHTKFQSVPLPRFIKSVTVHDFEFGSTPPELELKDITDPLPDFYEDNPAADDQDSDGSEEEDDDEGEYAEADNGDEVPDELRAATERRRKGAAPSAQPPPISTAAMNARLAQAQDLGSPFLGVSTPGIPGGTSSLNYFHSHLTGGLSGTQTPLAAVAGAHLSNSNNNGWMESGSSSPVSSSVPGHHEQHGQASVDSRAPSHSRNPSQSSMSGSDFHPVVGGLAPMHLKVGQGLREKSSVSTFAPTLSTGTSRPPTRDTSAPAAAGAAASGYEEDDNENGHGKQGGRFREARTEDIQAVFRIKYAGDVRLLLTADILLDYPMPSFVGIPLRLSITGLSFDGVGVIAYIRKRVHFCFLSPEDALAAVGADEGEQGAGGTGPPDRRPGKMGGLLQEIRVESEIGQRAGGRQSLKNVGKVERFVLEQVRRIFEEEFVYPSFWTFLV